MPDEEKYNDYDSEPVRYCSECYSLRIKYEEAIDADCCMDCGCSDTKEATIDQWEELYQSRYGHKYTVKNTDPKKSFIFKLSLKELKKKLYDHPAWLKIIQNLYPRFPEGLSKIDSVLLLFDRLIKDGRLDDLRMQMFQHIKKNN